jgi:hypothetical protein
MVRRYEVRDGVARALNQDEPAAPQVKGFSKTRNAPDQNVCLEQIDAQGVRIGGLEQRGFASLPRPLQKETFRRIFRKLEQPFEYHASLRGIACKLT